MLKFVFCLALSLSTGVALAQNSAGRISGTVVDSSGAAVPGAKITVTDQATKLAWKSATDNRGFYLVTTLPVGVFNVGVEAAGFRPALQSGYDLPDAGRITANFKLELGTVSETVTVTEVVGETVNTVSGEVARTIDSEQVADLALNGRNYMELVALIPGVAVTDLDQMARTSDPAINYQSINGNRTDTTQVMVDGGSNLDSGGNNTQNNNVGVDFVQQVRIQTSAFSAEYGRNSGASINVVTKSGGSQFHGSLFDVVRNDILDAKDTFAPVKPKLRFNDFNWTFSGPVPLGSFAKGKLFFFAGQEWKRIRKFSNPARTTLPTLAETGGDFSGRSNSIYYPGTKTPIPNKNLAPLMTADGKAIMNVYSAMIQLAAAYSNTPTSNNATFQMPQPFDWREDIVRVDWRPGDNHSIYVRYLHDAWQAIYPYGSHNASALPTTPDLRDRPGSSPQIGYIWTVNPHIINEARFNTSWNAQRTPLQGDKWKRSTYGFQYPRIFEGRGQYPEGMPDVTISGFTGFNGPARVYMQSPVTDFSPTNNITFILSPHTIKAGVMVIRNRKDQNGESIYDGSVAFNTSANTNTTNYSLADAVLGQYQTYTEANRDPVGFFRFTQYDAFVQDSWNVTRRLSLEIGLRYSHFIPTYTQGNNMANFIPELYNPARAVTITRTGLIVPGSGDRYQGLIRAGNGVPTDQVGRVAGATDPQTLAIPAGAPRGLYNSTNLFMPRFGFAWAPAGNARMSVRGGFGSFHDRPQGNMTFPQVLLPPFVYQAQYQSGNLANPLGGTEAAPAPLGTINSIDPNLKAPVTYTYNFGIERELTGGMFLQVMYAGNVGHHLLRRPNINQPSFATLQENQAIPSAQRPVTNAIVPYKGYSTINRFIGDSNSNYNALQTYLTRRRGNIIGTVSYTWAKSLSDASAYNSAPDAMEWMNRRYNYGPTTYDRRHVFVATYTYRIPFLRGTRGLIGAFGGWEMSGVIRVQTGAHLTPTGSASIPGTRRSQYLGGPVALPSDERGPNRWFNTAAFSNPPATALGNAGVGIIEGPGWQTWSLSLRKVFRMGERCNLRFQADAFNLWNHANYNSPNVSTSSNAFGSISSAQPARNIQFGVRLAF